MSVLWPRPVPTTGDTTSAAERAADPAGWAFAPADRDVLRRIMAARRDVRRFRPDPVDQATLTRVLAAAHAGPSVGHSQPWRFVLVSGVATRRKAALLADRARLAQAAGMEAESGRQLLDLDLEGIREAPLGVVVCCDRRVAPAGVLGRATFADADMWSCACAIENLWLAARAEGLGVGWVTLFRQEDLAALVGAPEGVATLGWLCLGWPDERPPAPGLERRGWSERLPLDAVVLHERWPGADGGVGGGVKPAPRPPVSRLLAAAGASVDAPDRAAVVAARDGADRLLTPPGSLGVLDRAVDRVVALGHRFLPGGTLVVAAADHRVTRHGVSAYRTEVTRHVAEAALAGRSVGAVAARTAGLEVVVIDAGVDGGPLAGAVAARPLGPVGDLVTTDALEAADVERLMAAGARVGRRLAAAGFVALGEVGVGNTTAAAALAAALLGGDPDRLVGLGAGSDSAIVAAKRRAVRLALARARGASGPASLLGALGGGELAVMAGVTLGAAAAGAVVMLDGMATCVAALVAVEIETAVASHLVAGQRSREAGHATVLGALGLEALLDLRLRAGEGAGAALAAGLLRSGLEVRASAARVAGGAVPAARLICGTTDV